MLIGMFVFTSFAYAGKVELTTYYPAPYGEYKNLNATEDASFATTSGGVIIGTTEPANLEVDNTLTLRSVPGAVGDQMGGSEGALRYSATAKGFVYNNGSEWVPLHGGPVFFDPPELLITIPNSQSAQAWSLNLSQFIPIGTTAIILEAEAAMDLPDGGAAANSARILVSLTSSSSTKYLLLRGSSRGSADGVAFGGQGTFPVDGTRSIYIKIAPKSFNEGGAVRLVGYYR